MQITRNLLVSFFLLSLASGAKASVNKNEAIIYECTLDSGVIQQHFEVGQTQRIYLNTNGLMQIQMPLEQGNSFEQFLLERLLASGINEGCARFLVKHVDAELLKLTNGQLLARVNFAFDSEELSDTARDILQQTVTMLKTANQRYLIEGHTDNIGSEQYNLALGDRRAQSVVTLLVSEGVDISALAIKSRGEMNPLQENIDEAGRQQNRRVDVTVIHSE